MKLAAVGFASFVLGAVGGAAAALIVWEQFERRFDFSRIVAELESGRIGARSSSRPLVGLGKPRATWVRPGASRFSCEMYYYHGEMLMLYESNKGLIAAQVVRPTGSYRDRWYFVDQSFAQYLGIPVEVAQPNTPLQPEPP